MTTFNARTEKVTVHLKNGYQLILRGRLSIILGLGEEEQKIVRTTVSPYVADLQGAMMMYIYCDIVQPPSCGRYECQTVKKHSCYRKMG